MSNAVDTEDLQNPREHYNLLGIDSKLPVKTLASESRAKPTTVTRKMSVEAQNGHLRSQTYVAKLTSLLSVSATQLRDHFFVCHRKSSNTKFQRTPNAKIS